MRQKAIGVTTIIYRSGNLLPISPIILEGLQYVPLRFSTKPLLTKAYTANAKKTSGPFLENPRNIYVVSGEAESNADICVMNTERN